MKTVIMAGGKGTRIASIDAQVPKPMLRILGKPILLWQMECLKRQGLDEFMLVVGHLGHVIRGYFGDGARHGVRIDYIEETEPLGTAGALYYLKDAIRDDFLLLNGDVIFDIDIERFALSHKRQGGVATLLTHPNDHPYDSGIVLADNDGRVTDWLHKEDARVWYKNRVNAGLHMLSPEIFSLFPSARKRDLDRDILRAVMRQGALRCYDSPEYVKDMGTPERLREVERDLASGVVAAKNLRNPQKAVFLDRDGTINRHAGFLTEPDDFALLPGVAENIRRINRSGYLAIVVTNQPVIARGDLSWEELTAIHNKMETLLGLEGAYVDDIYVCPHHPTKGFAGERVEYKVECSCRKPKPGMLLRAAETYNIDLPSSYMVGDTERDMEAGRAAGCKCVRVGR